MERKRILRVLAALMFIIVSSAKVFPQAALAKHAKLAEKIVNEVANIQENDHVLIYGGVRDAALMNELDLQANKIGAYPVITLDSWKRSRRYYDVVPAKYDTRKPAQFMDIMKLMQVVIGIPVDAPEGTFKDVPSSRLQARSKAFKAVRDIIKTHNIRTVHFGNGLYPTESLAKQFGITKARLSELFWKGVNVDYTTLQKTGNILKQLLASGNTLHLTNPAGTDLTLEITSRPILVDDGVLSKQEIEQGYPSNEVWLPAGEVIFTPVPGSAEGMVVLDHKYYEGDEIKNLTVKFKAGKMISMSATSGLGQYQKSYDAAEKGKDEFSYIDIGINPEIQRIPGSKMVTWMGSGMVTLGTGNNRWAGGNNTSSASFYYHLTNATLTIDDRVIVKNGVLVP